MLHEVRQTKKLVFVLLAAIAAIAIVWGLNTSEANALSGDGTEDSPYLISSEADWDEFVADVRTGETGKYYRLIDDIAVETMAGTPNNPFNGHFDGNGHALTASISDTSVDGTAPFRYIQGAEIKDLTVAGTIRGADYAAGLVGVAYHGQDKKNTIDNVNVAAAVNTSTNVEVGGIVGRIYRSNLTMTNTRFTGQLNGTWDFCGGLIGWMEGHELTMDNCLFSGSRAGGIGRFHPIGVKNNTIHDMSLTIGKVYYSSSAPIDMRGYENHGWVLTRDYNGSNERAIAAYEKNVADISNGHFYKAVEMKGVNTNYYYPVDIQFGFSKPFYKQHFDTDIVPQVTANNVELVQSTDYTVRFAPADYPGANMSPAQVLGSKGTYMGVIEGTGRYLGKWTKHFIVTDMAGQGTESNPYKIDNVNNWNDFCDILTTGNGVTFEGKYVKLEANITVNRMAGTESHPFCGIFDGNNKTLTSSISTEVDGTAPFHYIKGATIKNITAAGNVTGHEFTTGLVGYALGDRSVVNKVDKAVVKANITGSDYCGGVVGYGSNSTVVINNTVFSGKITCNLFNRRYSGAGFLVSGKGALLKMENCINKGTKDWFYWWNPISLKENNGFSAEIKTTYYLSNMEKGEEYGATPNIGGQLAQSSAFSGRVSTRVTAADNVKYYVDDKIKINGVKSFYKYNGGAAIDVDYTVEKADGTVLTKGTDYTEKITGTVNGLIRNEGNYTLTITGKGNYTGSTSVDFQVAEQLDGAGTRSDPFIVKSHNDWSILKKAVDKGYTYKDDYIKLAANITSSVIIGTSTHPFEGTINGDGHKLTVAMPLFNAGGVAPFAYVKGATIENLTVAGLIQGGIHSSGLIGRVMGGPVYVSNVRVSATVSTESNYLGGFIGHSGSNNEVNLVSCIFDGTLKSTASGAFGGGFAGWSDIPQFTMINCLFAGSVSGKFSLFHPAGIYNTAGGGYGGYKAGMIFYTASGAQKGSETGIAAPLKDWNVKTERVYKSNEAASGNLYRPFWMNGETTDYFVKADTSGINIDGVFVISEGDTIDPEPVVKCEGDTVDPQNYTLKYFTEDGAEVDGNSIGETGTYKVEATGKAPYCAGSVSTTFKVISFDGEGTEAEPYWLYETEDWNNFAEAVAKGHTFKGEYVALANSDIDVTVPVGTEEHPFKGNFNGDPRYYGNHDLNVNLDDTQNAGTAPFRYVADGAVIQKVNVQGTVKGGIHSAGLVGFASSGDVEIYRVKVSAAITDGSHVGGIVGHGKKSNLTITDSAYTGTITGGSSYIGGLLGWSDGQTLHLERCIFSGRSMGPGAFHPIAVRNADTRMNTNEQKVYYVNTQAPAIGAANTAANGTPVYTSATFPDDKLVSSITAADGAAYYAPVKVGTIAESYEITGRGIAPVPSVTDVEGYPLSNSRDYTACYIPEGSTESLDKVTEPGDYTLVLKGNNKKTLGAHEVGTFTAEATYVQRVTLNKNAATLFFDEGENTVQLEAAVEPATALDKTVTWSSGDESIATVNDDGLVTAVGVGNVTITAKANDDSQGVKKATCLVTVAKSQAKIIVPPSRNVLTYNGEPQALMNQGEASGGTIYYAVGGGEYSEDIPERTDAGSYNVAYKVVPDDKHTASAPMYAIVTIDKAEGGAVITKQAQVKTGKTLDLNTLVTGDTSGGVTYTMKDAGETGSTISGNEFTAGSPGTCTIEVTVAERANYEQLKEEVDITITEKEINTDDVEVTMDSWTYGQTGDTPHFTIPGNPPEDDVDIYYLGRKRNGESYVNVEKVKPQDAGEYQVFVLYEGEDYIYFGVAEFEIKPKSIEGAEITLGDSLTYTGEEQEQTISKVMLGQTDITEFCRNGGNYAEEDPYDPEDDQIKYTVVNAGNYIMVVTANENSNYTGSVNAPFTVAKADPVISVEPKAISNLEYTGNEQVLIEQGTVEGGILKYNMGAGGFTEKMPAAIDAGLYQVNYRVYGDANHNNLYDNHFIDVEIAPVACTVGTAPQAKENLIYTGEKQQLVTEGASGDGDMLYRIGSSQDADFSAIVPEAKQAGEYEIYYKVKARDENHSDSKVSGPVTVTIGKADAQVTKAPEAVEGLVYNGKEQALVTAGEVSGGTMVYSLEENGEFTEEIPAVTDAGKYTVYYKIAGGDNYRDSDETGSVDVEVAEAPFPGSVLRRSGQVKYGQEVDISGYVHSDMELEYSIDSQDPDDLGCTIEGSILTAGDKDGKCWITIKAKGSSNYESEAVYLNISDLTFVDIGVYQDDFTYGETTADPKYDDYGVPPVGALTILYAGTMANGEEYGDTDEEVYKAPTEAGLYELLVLYRIDNTVYAGETEFAIKPADISKAKVTLGKELKANGKEQTQEVSKIELNGQDITGLCTVKDNKATKAGDYKLTITPDTDAYNYHGSAEAAFTVYPDDKTLAAAKTKAIKALTDKYKLANYSGKQKTAVKKALAAAKTAINKAKTLPQVDKAKAAAVKKLSVVKKNNTIKAKGKTVKAKYTKVKKKALKIKKTKAFKVTKAKGKVTYKRGKITAKKKLLKQAKKKIKIAKNGKITLKKGLKKGTYKVKVKVRAAGNKYFKAKTRTVTVKIVVR
ncbi:MAG: Ig-like domain-containing protein [Bacillota bacterium]|nr:Ig-like domain-containing protein [Bacillota bacterium]